MKVIVDSEVLNSVSQSQDAWKLHHLMIQCSSGRHTVLFTDDAAVATWLNSIDKGTREGYRVSLDLSIRQTVAMAANTPTIWVTNGTDADFGVENSSLSLDNALALLNEPLAIFVENEDNDFKFLLGIMRRSERDKITAAIEKGWVRVAHGGGGTIKQILKNRAIRPKEHVRTFVVFDSDRRHPDELDPKWQPTPPEACEGFDVQQVVKDHYAGRYWMLKRRFIESYMPRHAIERGQNRDTHSLAAEIFFNMSKNAQWFFNMKRGFDGDFPIENRHRSKQLYITLSEEDRNALKKGFGRTLADQYQLTSEEEFNWDSDAIHEASIAVPSLMRLL